MRRRQNMKQIVYSWRLCSSQVSETCQEIIEACECVWNIILSCDNTLTHTETKLFEIVWTRPRDHRAPCDAHLEGGLVTLQRVFTRVTNISVGDTLTLRRMRLACNMVKTGKPGTIKVFMRLVISYLPPTTMREESEEQGVQKTWDWDNLFRMWHTQTFMEFWGETDNCLLHCVQDDCCTGLACCFTDNPSMIFISSILTSNYPNCWAPLSQVSGWSQVSSKVWR